MSPVSYHALHEADTVCDEKQDADTLNHERKKKLIKNIEKKKEKKNFKKARKLQCLSIGGEARKTDEEFIVNFGNPLEIGGYGLKLNTESPIAGNGEAVLANHGH
jgi:hypothetical protein